MAQNLATTNGNDVHGRSPVHKLGTKLDQPATAREAIEAAGLNYRVDLKSLNTAVTGITRPLLLPSGTSS